MDSLIFTKKNTQKLAIESVSLIVNTIDRHFVSKDVSLCFKTAFSFWFVLATLSSKKMEPTVKIAAGSVVCAEHTKIIGEVSIGSKTVIHPTALIHAKNGPIIIGECNLIEERAVIVNNSSQPMMIGSYNVFEVGCHSEAPAVGDSNVLEYKSFVGPKTFVSRGCVIGAKCSVNTDEVLPVNTVIYGNECKRRIQGSDPTPQPFQLDFLIKVLPNYQKIHQPNSRATEIPTPVASSIAMSPTN
jgi:dynactin-6